MGMGRCRGLRRGLQLMHDTHGRQMDSMRAGRLWQPTLHDLGSGRHPPQHAPRLRCAGAPRGRPGRKRVPMAFPPCFKAPDC